MIRSDLLLTVIFFLTNNSSRRKLHEKSRNSPCDFGQLSLNMPDNAHQKEYTFFSLLDVHLQAKNNLLLIKETCNISDREYQYSLTFQTTLISLKCVKPSFYDIFITTESS